MDSFFCLFKELSLHWDISIGSAENYDDKENTNSPSLSHDLSLFLPLPTPLSSLSTSHLSLIAMKHIYSIIVALFVYTPTFCHTLAVLFSTLRGRLHALSLSLSLYVCLFSCISPSLFLSLSLSLSLYLSLSPFLSITLYTPQNSHQTCSPLLSLRLAERDALLTTLKAIGKVPDRLDSSPFNKKGQSADKKSDSESVKFMSSLTEGWNAFERMLKQVLSQLTIRLDTYSHSSLDHMTRVSDEELRASFPPKNRKGKVARAGKQRVCECSLSLPSSSSSDEKKNGNEKKKKNDMQVEPQEKPQM